MTIRFAHQAELGITVVDHGFPGTADPFPAPDEVTAGRAALQARGVDRTTHNASPATQVKSNGSVQQLPRGSGYQQSLRRLFKCSEVGKLFQVECFDQRRMIRKMRDDPAVIGLEKTFERQASEELMLRELLGTAGMSISRQRSTRRRQGSQHNCLRRLARR